MEQNNNDLEAKIIENARELFIERGFVETSMSDIAAKTGINRPVLHYYFRTKDRMFQAVFGSILETLLPRLQDIISNRDDSIEARLGKVIDAYYNIFKAHPTLPLFVMREMNRDYEHFEQTFTELHIERYFIAIKSALEQEMDCGSIKMMQFRHLFMTFYSMLVIPFTVRPLCEHLFLDEGESYDDLLQKWRTHVLTQMVRMLSDSK